MAESSRSAPVSVIILSNSEEANIGACLSHVMGWAAEVFVLDSGSTDRTIEIARAKGAAVFEHAFEGYSRQRNWALDALPITTEWVMFIDADEYPTEELKEEIKSRVNQKTNDGINGYYIKRRFIWEGKWIRRGGYYPVWLLRLFRRGGGRWDESVKMDEHVILSGKTGRLEHDLMHEDRRGLVVWKERHRKYSLLKAEEYWLRRSASAEVGVPTSRTANVGRDREQERREAKRTLYDKLPLFFRAVLYFKYVFFLKLGFLDGPKGWQFHWLRSLWYPWTIDREIVRMRRNQKLP